jgi:hypothetical protein
MQFPRADSWRAIPRHTAKVPDLKPCPFGQSFFGRKAIFSELLKKAFGRNQ